MGGVGARDVRQIFDCLEGTEHRDVMVGYFYNH